MPRRRAPKNVAPPEVDLPDDVLAALGEPRSPGLIEKLGEAVERYPIGSPAETDPEPKTLAQVGAELVPLTDQLSATIADIALIPVARATPEQRTDLIDLRQRLDTMRADLSTWVAAIDISFRRAALETNASEFVLADGVVKVEQQRGEWVVNVPALRAELKEFVAHGTISQAEFDSIFKTEIVESANNTQLNAVANKRGAEIAEAINRGRSWKPGDPANARVRIQRGGR